MLAHLVGCQSLPDESWHYTAERTVYTAVQTADRFISFEAEHRAEIAPAVAQAADAIRRQMPPAVRETRAALALYREALSQGAGAEEAAYLQRIAEANMQLITHLAATAASAYARVQQSE